MARIRTIKPEFPHSESMGKVSREARLCFILIWTLADDSGRLRGNSRMLASLLFPYDDDAPGLIEGWLAELEQEECIVRYSIEGSTYLEVCNWLEHQKIDKPSKSKIPSPLEGSRILSKARECSSLDQGSRTKDQGRDQGPGVDHFSCSEPSSTTASKQEEGSCQSPPESSGPSTPSAPPLMVFPCVGTGTKEWSLLPGKLAEWSESFPKVDVMAECRKARQWLLDNPTRRKTAHGMPKFLGSWLARKQDEFTQARSGSPNLPQRTLNNMAAVAAVLGKDGNGHAS